MVEDDVAAFVRHHAALHLARVELVDRDLKNRFELVWVKSPTFLPQQSVNKRTFLVLAVLLVWQP